MSDGNEGVLRIPQSSSITDGSPSVCLMSYLGHYLVCVLPFCREAVGVFNKIKKENISTLKDGSLKLVVKFTYLRSCILSTESDINL